MIHNSKNRYSLTPPWLSGLLQETAMKPVAILLLVALFLTSAFEGAYVGHQSCGSTQANLYALDDVSDLLFSPAESRQFSVCGENQENSADDKLKVRSECCQFEILALYSPPGPQFITSNASPLCSKPNTSPSSPRPPPISAAKA